MLLIPPGVGLPADRFVIHEAANHSRCFPLPVAGLAIASHTSRAGDRRQGNNPCNGKVRHTLVTAEIARTATISEWRRQL